MERHAGITFDLFQRDRDGLMATRASSIPETVGAAMPQENLESDRTMGFELALSHRNRIGSDFSYNVNANISLTRTKWTDRVRESFGNSWDYWRFCEEGRYTNIMFGHGADGQYNSWDDIINSPVFVGKGTLPGDYRYEDYNGDGVIDGEDHHPIATNSIPQLYYGFSIGAQYKGFDLDLLFQGAAMSHVSFPEMFNEPLMWNGNALEQFLDRWHPSDPAADPYDPQYQMEFGLLCLHGTKDGSEFDALSRERLLPASEKYRTGLYAAQATGIENRHSESPYLHQLLQSSHVQFAGLRRPGTSEQ